MRTLKKVLIGVVTAGALTVPFVNLNVPEVQAYPYTSQCEMPVAMSDSAFGGYCDDAPMPSGQHWHCEWTYLIINSRHCSWRWGDNTFAPPS